MKIKKIIACLSSLAIMATVSISNIGKLNIPILNSLSISADAASTSNGLEYTVSGSYASITGYTGTSSTLTIPSTITANGSTYIVNRISMYAFHNNDIIKNVYISSNVTNISNDAFHNCSNLEYVSIPNTVTSISSSAFYQCLNLVNVSFASNSKLETIDQSAFMGCDSLVSISIPDSVTTIGLAAFYGNENLKTVSINNLSSKLKSIYNSAFGDCYNLVNITLPNSLEYIGSLAFNRCGLTTVSIPQNVTFIGSTAFALSESITQVKFAGAAQNSLQVGYFAFKGCTSLQSVTINKYKSVSFGNESFNNCTSLSNVTFPKTNGSIDISGITFGADSFTNTPFYPIYIYLFG